MDNIKNNTYIFVCQCIWW